MSAWWARRPDTVRDSVIDYRILFGIAVAIAVLAYLSIVVAFIREVPIRTIGPSITLIPLGLFLASSFSRKAREADARINIRVTVKRKAPGLE
jgi:hypothetical protein